jgi:hypothetical protein
VPPLPLSDAAAAAIASAPALLVALLGWGLQIRTHRQTVAVLEKEIERLTTLLTLAMVGGRRVDPEAGGASPAPGPRRP